MIEPATSSKVSSDPKTPGATIDQTLIGSYSTTFLETRVQKTFLENFLT